ncbi:MAG TPA: polysaccharide biosynthesis C-terminal domain-containing protein [Tepidisphaeraceae bacterium]|nr:polysaccharide biosynthesis C-terminal domain-containing protein [Tepidisphaeraceae bacterium]
MSSAVQSTLAPALAPATAPAASAAPPVARRALKSWAATRFLGRNVWAISDQGLISATNFATMVLTARALGPSEFGTFSLAYSALLLANILQATLVTQPHNVLAATRGGKEYVRYTTTTALSQVLIASLQAAAALAVAGVAYAQGWHAAPLLLALAPSIVAWQFQEFVRRVLYTENRHGAAFANDCVSYGGQTLVIAWLWWAGTLTGTGAMYALAVTSAIAAALGGWQLRASLGMHFDRRVLVENWHFGKWLTGGEILQWVSSLHMYLYLAAAILGTTATGELRAAQILFGPTRVLSFYLGTVLPIRFARTLVERGDAGVHVQFLDACRKVLPVLAAYSLVVAVFAEPLLDLMYGPDYAGDAIVLSLYAACAFVSYCQVVFTSALTAKRQTRSVCDGYVAGAVVTVALSWWIIRWLGVAGAPTALAVSSAVITLWFWRAYHRSRMTAAAMVPDVAAPPPAEPSPARAAVLRDVFQSFERTETPYCVMHGYAGLPDRIGGDIDCVVPAAALQSRLPLALGAPVQFVDDRSPYVVVAGARRDPSPPLVALHVSPNYEIGGRVLFAAEEILATRRRHNGFWVPAADVEFGCVLANRVAKRSLRVDHADRLAALYAEDPAGCERQARRVLPDDIAEVIITAARTGDWTAARAGIDAAADALLARATRRQWARLALREVSRHARRARRWVAPRNGLHVVFLGPDGVGKSTVIDAVREAIAPAFLRTDYRTFAPSLVPPALQVTKKTPHALPPRSLAGSLLKAAWWFVCYTAGYYVAIRPPLARASLVLNHRYLLDAIVDPKRYRYAGPSWILRAIWRVAPRPDLVVLLDAPPEVIQSRKQEVPFEETARQVDGYRRLLDGLPNGHVVNAARPLDEVVADVNGILLDHLAARTARRLKRMGSAW